MMKIQVGLVSQLFLDMFRNKIVPIAENPSASERRVPTTHSARSGGLCVPQRHTFVSAGQPGPGKKSCF
jgi:hypothetical protein